MNVKKTVHSLLDAIVPERCVLCGDYISASTRIGVYPVCGPCREKIVGPPGNRCTLCSLPLISEIEICTACRVKTFHFDYNHSVFIYGNAIKECISFFKAGKVRSFGELFAEALAKAYFIRYKTLPVVPVPSRPSSVRKRGFDQVGVICEALHRSCRITVFDCLRRGGLDREQKTLNREEREKNLLGSIGIKRKWKTSFPDSVVLIDDVFTTGATANECSKILKTRGVRHVYVLTLARD